MKVGEVAGLHPGAKPQKRLCLSENRPVSPQQLLLLPVHLVCTVCRKLSPALDNKGLNIRTVCRTHW